MAIGDVFPNPSGREYALPWSNGSGKGQSGTIKMTDFLFNYYFYSSAFGLDGAYYERDVRGNDSITMTRWIGGPSVTYKRAGYKRKITPTTRGGAYDSGLDLYAIDGDDVWNFEISGKLEEFRLWLNKVAKANNLKRTLAYKTATGVQAAAVPSLTQNP